MGFIVKHFGEALISGMVLGLLFLFLFGANKNGFLYQMHENVPEVKSVYAASGNNDKFARIISSAKPEITYKNTLDNGTKNKIVTNTTYDLSDLFLAQDVNGIKLDVAVKDVIEKKTGKSVLWSEDEATGEKTALQEPVAFRFSSEGVYTINLVTTDGNGVTIKKTMQIPVSEN